MLNWFTVHAEHIGKRNEQQDAHQIFHNDQSTLIVVADGVGGSTDGALASKAVVDAAEYVWEEHSGNFSNPEQQLYNICYLAHEKVKAIPHENKRGPASTVVLLYTIGSEVHWMHCGDSRLYWVRKNKLVLRTRDHSVIQMLVEQEKITEEEALTHPDKGRVTKTISASSFSKPEYGSGTAQHADQFLLCTDGFWESMPHNVSIGSIIGTAKKLPHTIQQIAEDAVIRNGEKSDNITLAIAILNDPPTINQQAQQITTKKKANSQEAMTLFAISFFFFSILILIAVYIL